MVSVPVKNRLRSFPAIALALALSCFLFWHLFQVCRLSVDIPHMDEWELFGPNGLQNGWSAKYLLAFQNEHRLLIPKLFYLINLDLFHLDFRLQVILNAAIYLILCEVTWKLFLKNYGLQTNLFAWIAMAPLVSNLLFEVHPSAILGNMAFVLICLFLSAQILWNEPGWKGFCFVLAMMVVSIYSFASLVVGALGLGALYLCEIIRSGRPRRWLQIGIFFLVIGITVVFWFQGYQRNPGHPGYVAPWSFGFIRYWMELIAMGFGFNDLSLSASLLCTGIVVAALLAGAYALRKSDSSSRATSMVLSLTVILLAMLAVVAFGRAGFPLSTAKSSRYVPLSIFLPLLSLVLFSRLPRNFYLGQALVALVLIFSLRDNFGLQIYRQIHEDRVSEKNCVQEILAKPPDSLKTICAKTYPGPLGERLKIARELKVRFTEPRFLIFSKNGEASQF